MTDEFFEIVDSHPMTDEEANDRYSKCSPRLLPQYDQYVRAHNGLISADPQWLLDYEDYTKAWLSLGAKFDAKNPFWTAEKRKLLVSLEVYFESTAVDWLGG